MGSSDLIADLVLEGGGVKGIALVGAIEVLEEHGYHFKRVAGTSAGAIVGALVAAGVPAPELVTIMGSLHYPDFCDGSWYTDSLPGKALAVATRLGVYRGDHLKTWLQEQLEAYGIHTFADLHYQDPDRPLPPHQAFRLVVTASDLSHGRLSYLPWDYERHGHEPDAHPVVEAVRASMSIPFFYRPARCETSNGEKVWLVDGGMLSNFPITVFDSPRDSTPRWPTFGIKLSGPPEAPQGSPSMITGPLSMGRAMIKTMTGFYDRMHIDSPDAQARTIFVDTGSIRATDFDLTAAQRDTLYQAGRNAARKFLSGAPDRPAWNFQDYIRTHRTSPESGPSRRDHNDRPVPPPGSAPSNNGTVGAFQICMGRGLPPGLVSSCCQEVSEAIIFEAPGDPAHGLDDSQTASVGSPEPPTMSKPSDPPA